LRKLTDELVDLRLGAHVDPACRLVEEEQGDPRQEELPDHDLLLVAAAQVGDQGIDKGS
jgi:hypothetical protein